MICPPDHTQVDDDCRTWKLPVEVEVFRGEVPLWSGVTDDLTGDVSAEVNGTGELHVVGVSPLLPEELISEPVTVAEDGATAEVVLVSPMFFEFRPSDAFG